MSDLISRQAAIAAIEFDITYAKAINKDTGEVTVMFEKENKALEDAVTRIKQLPPAQPKRIIGKWIATTSLQEGQITWRDYKCSNCSHHRGKPMNFCEVCGAKMER